MTSVTPKLGRAVASALRDAQTLPRDAAAVSLVKRYAALIDRAEELAEALDGVRAEDEVEARLLAALRVKVEAQAVASDLGPKLLAALAALGMTPAARSAVSKGGAPDVRSSAADDALARLRAKRGAGSNRS